MCQSYFTWNLVVHRKPQYFYHLFSHIPFSWLSDMRLCSCCLPLQPLCYPLMGICPLCCVLVWDWCSLRRVFVWLLAVLMFQAFALQYCSCFSFFFTYYNCISVLQAQADVTHNITNTNTRTVVGLGQTNTFFTFHLHCVCVCTDC